MHFPLNKYGEVEIQNDELRYFFPIVHTDVNDLETFEKSYRKKKQELSDSDCYIFANQLDVVRDRFCFSFQLENMKAYHYIRQFAFVEQLYYFQSLVKLAQNYKKTPILFDRNSLLLDLTDRKIKTFVFGFSKHKIHIIVDPVEGLREMILFALTTLNHVIEKPRRVDFIDQRDVVIRFAENILHAKSVNEIEQHIAESILEFERQLESEKKASKSKLNFNFASIASKFRIKSNEKDESPKEFDYETPEETSEVTATVVEDTNRKDKTETEQEKPEEKNPKEYIQRSVTAIGKLIKSKKKAVSPEMLIDAYQAALLGQKQEALDILERFGYDNLNKKDQKIMLLLYKDTDQAKKALKLSPEFAEEIVTDFVSKGKLEDLRDLEDLNNPVINYELAYLDGKWESVLELRKYVKMTNRRRGQLVSAHLNMGRIEEAKKLAEEDSELNKKIKDYVVERYRMLENYI